MDVRTANRLSRAAALAALALALAACSGGNSGEPTAQTSSDDASANAPLVPSQASSPSQATSPSEANGASQAASPAQAPGSTSASVKRGAVPIVPRTGGPPKQLTSSEKPATGSPPPAPVSGYACVTRQLKVRVIRESATTALLTLTNTSKSTCTLSGWPTVGLAQGGTPAALQTINVNEPNAPVGIALRPGRTAFAGLRWKPCAAKAPRCRAGDSLQVGPPGSTQTALRLTGFPGNRLAMSLLEIGAIQPTTTNIVDW